MTQSIKGVRAALFAACQTLYGSSRDSVGGEVLVSYGFPGSYQPQTIVAVGLTSRQPVTRPTLGTNRSRDKVAQVDVTISVYRAGAAENVQQAATEDCDDLVLLLEAYFRTSPNEALGGACRDAWVSEIDGPNLDPATQLDSGAVTGYTAEAVVTVTANIRY